MAAKPKLTPEEWKHARDVWERATKKGFPWLIEELGLPVSAEAVRLKSKNEAWKKKDKPSLENKKNKLGKNNKKTASTDAPVKQNIVDVRVSGEGGRDVAEESKIHGNSKYSVSYNKQVYKLCLLGATDLEIADFFNVSETTINNWKHDYPNFFESIRKGKLSADAEMAYRFYVKGCGYRYKEIRERAAVVGDDEEKVQRVEVITTEKEIPPDAGAAFRWLMNRRPGNWKDKVESSGDVKLDKETLQQIEETFLVRMEKARARQDKILIERGILIEQESG
jgi:hypothetical protein